MTIHTYNIGKYKTKTCNVYFKSMRSDNLKRHMKKQERGNGDNIVIVLNKTVIVLNKTNKIKGCVFIVRLYLYHYPGSFGNKQSCE